MAAKGIAELVLLGPCGNALNFKAFENPAMLFERGVNPHCLGPFAQVNGLRRALKNGAAVRQATDSSVSPACSRWVWNSISFHMS